MKKSKRQILSLMAAAVMAAGLLSGCGGTEGSGGNHRGSSRNDGCGGRRRRSCCGRRDRGCGRGHGGLFRCRDHLRYDFAGDTVNPYGSSSVPFTSSWQWIRSTTVWLSWRRPVLM